MNSDQLSTITDLISNETKPHDANGQEIREDLDALLDQQSEYGSISNDSLPQGIFVVKTILSNDRHAQLNNFDEEKR